MVVRRVVLPPHSSRVSGLVLLLGYHVCGISHVWSSPSVCMGFFWSSLASQKHTNKWISYSQLPLGMNVCMVPFDGLASHSCCIPVSCSVNLE